MAEGVGVVATFHVAKGKKEQIETLFSDLAAIITRIGEGMITGDVFHHKTNEDGTEEYILVEQFESQAVLEAWAVKPEHVALQKRMEEPGLLVVPNDVKIVKPLFSAAPRF